MGYLLDTNVVSELVRARPEPQVLAWFDGVPEVALHLSVLTLGEIRKGVERAAIGESRRETLRRWLEHDLPARFAERLLPVDAVVADRWGRLQVQAVRPLPVIDALLAATALAHDLRLVTRNAADFVHPGLLVVDPWETGRGRPE